MQEQGSGGGGSTMLRTRPNTIIRGDVQGEYVVRGAKIKCSKALRKEAYDVVNLPLCHGVYSGKEPLINIKDMKDGENIVNGFGICSETGTACVDEMKFHINWINRKKIRLHIEGEQAVTTNSFTMCSAHGGEITFENSGQTAVYHPKNEKNKEDLMGEEARDKTMDSMTSLMACEKGLKDLSRQWFEASGNPKKQKALHEQADKIREHMVYLAESSPVRPEILLDLKRSVGDGTTEKQHLRPDEVMAINVINETLKKKEVKEELGFWDKTGKVVYASSEVVLGGFTTAGGVVIVGTAVGGTAVTGGGAAPVSVPMAAGGAATVAHGANSVGNGFRDFKHIYDGDWEKVGSENFLKDEVYEPAFEKLGKVADHLSRNDNGDGARVGKSIGSVVYYVIDIRTGIKGTIGSFKMLNKAKWTRGVFTQTSGGIVTLETLNGNSSNPVIISNIAKDGIGYYYNLKSAKNDFEEIDEEIGGGNEEAR